MSRVYGAFYRDPKQTDPDRQYHWAQGTTPLIALNVLEANCDVFPDEFDLQVPEGEANFLIEVVGR